MSTAAEVSSLSLQQHLASLWADELLQVHAVVLGHRVPGLRARLALGGVGSWDQLWSGALEADEREAAPHLVHLERGSAFTDWLLNQAEAAHGPWGVLVRTRVPFLTLRTHGRALCEATLPDGEAVRIDWADPEVLGTLLPLTDAAQLQRVFAPLESIIATGREAWTRWSLALGRLQVQRTGVLAG